MDNTILGGTGKNSLYGGNGDDSIIGGKSADKLYGQNGDDILAGGKGNDTLTGGEGADVFVYVKGDGKDVITDYSYDEGDVISLGAAFTDITSTLSGSNAVISLGSGNTVSILGGKAKMLNLVDSTGTELETVIGGLIIYDSIKSPISLTGTYADIEYVDARPRTKTAKIVGNSSDNIILGGSGKNTLYGNDGDDSIIGGKNADKLYGQNGDDTLAGGAGNDTLTGGDGADVFLYAKGSGKDVIVDYVAGEDVISLGASFDDITSTLSGSNAVISLSSGNTVSILGGKAKMLSLIDSTGTELETVIGGLVVYDSLKSPISLTGAYADIEYVDARPRTKTVKIVGNALENTILGGSNKNSLYGGDGDDSIIGGTNNDKLYGDSGEDTLWGNTGNDTLTGGAGDDFFIYSAGNDIITDYATGDLISINAAKEAISWNDSGANDIVLTVKNKGKVTLKKAKTVLWNAIDNNGEYVRPDVLVLTNDDSINHSILANTEIKIVDALARTKNTSIVANDYNNSVYGGSGQDIINGMQGDDYLLGNNGRDSLFGGSGADTLLGGSGNDYLDGGSNEDSLSGGEGDDTLIGGTGNDSLWGGEGSDTFVYAKGDGKDIIYDFDDNDLLQITGTFSASVNSAGNVVFKVGSTASAITLKNFTATTFNVNGDTYKISGSKLVK